MWIRKNATLLRSAFQNWLDHRGSASSRRKFSSPDEGPDAGFVARVEAQPDRVDERVDGEGRIDDERRRQKHRDVEREARPFRGARHAPGRYGGTGRHSIPPHAVEGRGRSGRLRMSVSTYLRAGTSWRARPALSGRFLGFHGAVQNLCAHVPELVLEIGRSAREI